MQTLREMIEGYENRLRAAGFSVSVLTERANIDRSTWTRWKQGKQGPTLKKIQQVEATLRRLEAEARFR
jgi:transcriptional regulator with XRE-family HTH domain